MQEKIKDDVISRQAAIDALRMDIDIIPFAKAREYARAVIETIHNRIEELPSAQPEIIRCKDCKWSDWYDVDGHKYCYCIETGVSGRTADDFCSYAERETDEQND